MSKLKGYVAAPDEEDSARKFIKLQELFTRRKELLAGNFQVGGLLPRRDDGKTRLQHFVSHPNCVFPDETVAAMECHNACLPEAFFTVLRHVLVGGTFKAHQLAPVN